MREAGTKNGEYKMSKLIIGKTGCGMYKDCLTCPFPKCIYDTKAEVMKLRKIEEQTAIRSTKWIEMQLQ